jgi:hypothetical protein
MVKLLSWVPAAGLRETDPGVGQELGELDPTNLSEIK